MNTPAQDTVTSAFDAGGIWHDPGTGRFAKPGWSSAKALALRTIRGAAAMHQTRDGDPDGTWLHTADHVPSIGLSKGQPVKVRYVDAEFGAVDIDGRPTRVRWERFADGAVDVNAMAERPSTKRALWTSAIGSMHRGAESEYETSASTAFETALKTVTEADSVAVGAAVFRLPEHKREAFGVKRQHPDEAFPNGELPAGVAFYDATSGVAVATPTVENTAAYRTLQHERTKAAAGKRDPVTARAEWVWMEDATAEAQSLADQMSLVPPSNRIATRSEYVEQVGRNLFASSLAGWNRSALNFPGLVAQRAVSEAFNIGYDDTRVNPDVRADADRLYRAAPDAWRRFVESIYRSTQTHLARVGVGEATVFRGSDGGVGSPLVSWSVSPNIARVFGRRVVRASIPVQDVFATPVSVGIGKSEEAELVVLNRPRPVTEIDFMSGVPDGRMFDMWFDRDQGDVAFPGDADGIDSTE